MSESLVYPAPGDKPIVAVPLPDGEWRDYRSVTCWCGKRWIAASPEQAVDVADRHHRTHRWVNRWPRLLGPAAWSLTARDRS